MLSTHRVVLTYIPNYGLAGAVRWLPNGFTPPSHDDYGEQTPNLGVGETEQLLNIDGLLEIARLIEKIKQDGRLSRKNDNHPKRTDTQRRNRLKD